MKRFFETIRPTTHVTGRFHALGYVASGQVALNMRDYPRI